LKYQKLKKNQDWQIGYYVTNRKSKSKRKQILLFLLLFVFTDELMLTHHELASP